MTRVLFTIMDVVYGNARTLEKFRVLELVARVPYQAWENVAYVAMTHTSRAPGFARRVFDSVRTSRWEQDNATAITRTRNAVTEFGESPADLAALSVLLRQIRTLVRTSRAS